MADRKRTAKRETRAPSPPFSLTTGWAGVILALLVVLFFNAVIVGGKTFVSPDTTQPAGFVRIGEHSLYHDHVYPLWNPFVFLGMPSFASGAYNPLIYPPDWPVAIVQKILPLPELTWMLLYYFLAGFFMFLLAREWGARAEAALLAAVAFVYQPNLVAIGSHGHGSQLVDSAYIPLMLWLASRWMRGGGWASLGWLALAGGFQMLRGHVQVCFYTWVAIGIYSGVEWLAALRRPAELLRNTARLAGLAAAAGLAFGIAGFYNLPLRDYSRYSIRGTGSGGGVGIDYATQWSLAPYELPSFVIPGWVGFGGSTYWGGMPFTDYPNGYIGIVALVLGLAAFLAGGAPRLFALAIAILSLLIAFGRNFPLYGFLYDHLPLFNKFRVPVMVIVLFQLAAALGLGWGWSAVIERGPGEASRARLLDRLLLVLGVTLGLVTLVGVLGQDAWRQPYVAAAVAHRQAAGQPFSAEVAALAYGGFIGDLGRAGLLGLLALGVAWLARRAKLSAAAASIALLVLLLVELWPVSGRVMESALGDPVQRNLEIGRDDVIDFLEKAGPPGSFRILPPEFEFQSNRYAGFGIASLGGYHAAKPRLVQDFLEAQLPYNLGWLSLLNVRYVVTPQPMQPAPAWLRQVFAGSGYVYENLLALPRVTVLGRYRVVTPAKAILDSVKNGSSESSEVTFLEQDPKLGLGPVRGARAEITSYRLNDVTIEVETPGPALVRLADLWYPDWTATVDGRPTAVLRADYLLRAVAVPAGRHRVMFRFRSPALARGLTISVVCLVVTLGLLGLSFWWRRRPAQSAPEAA